MPPSYTTPSSGALSQSQRKARIANSANILHLNAVYWPNYRFRNNGDTPGQLNYRCINRVYYAYADVTADGQVFVSFKNYSAPSNGLLNPFPNQLSDDEADCRAPCDGLNKGALGSLLHLAHSERHLQALISIGGSDSAQTFPIVASNPVLRNKFARSVRDLVEDTGIDGIDSESHILLIQISRELKTGVVLTNQVVWEYPSTPQQGCDFLSLLAEIRNYLPDDRYLLTASLPVGGLENIDVQCAASYLDTLNLVAYRFFNHWSKKTGHHAQLYSMNKSDLSVDAGVRFLLANGVPAKKILLGIPLFGNSFLGVNGPGHKNRGMGGDGGSFEYSQLPRKGTKERVDKQAVAAYCVGGDGGFVSYDNPDTVREKASYCKQKGLGVRFVHPFLPVLILTRPLI